MSKPDKRRLDHGFRACDGIRVPATAPTLRGFKHRPVGCSRRPNHFLADFRFARLQRREPAKRRHRGFFSAVQL
jgi:hypothetical protein